MIEPIQDRPLAPLTTFGIGGAADFYIECRSKEALVEAIDFAKARALPIHLLGKGSNTLFDDRGFKGVVIHNKIDLFQDRGQGLFYVGAGFSFPLFGIKTAKAGFTGFEFAAGIPASVGGAIFMNAGANGQESSTYLHEVDYLDFDVGLKTISKDQLVFRYRHSSFQEWKGAILGGLFALPRGEKAREKQLAIIETRTKSQPYDDKSAGCVFRNPECGRAGEIIDELGLKGFSIGGAEISVKHANFIVNKGGAKASDVIALIRHIQNAVKEKRSLDLEPEVRVIPYDPLC